MFYVKEKTDEIEVKVELNSENVFCSCPDCGKEHAIFGESKVDKVAKEFGIENTARLPIDPVIAAMVDAGEVESVDGGNISGIADVIERRGNK